MEISRNNDQKDAFLKKFQLENHSLTFNHKNKITSHIFQLPAFYLVHL